MGWFDIGWGLATIMALPLAGTVVILLSQPKSEDLIKGVAFVTSLLTFMLSVVAARSFSPEPGEEIVIDAFLGGVPGLADRYYVTSFGLRLPIVVLFGFLATLVVIYSYKQWQRQSHAKAIIMFTLLALDILMFELVFEEGTPPPAALGLVGVACAQRWFFNGPTRFQAISRSRPRHGVAAGRTDDFEEEMSGLVR